MALLCDLKVVEFPLEGAGWNKFSLRKKKIVW